MKIVKVRIDCCKIRSIRPPPHCALVRYGRSISGVCVWRGEVLQICPKSLEYALVTLFCCWTICVTVSGSLLQLLTFPRVFVSVLAMQMGVAVTVANQYTCIRPVLLLGIIDRDRVLGQAFLTLLLCPQNNSKDAPRKSVIRPQAEKAVSIQKPGVILCPGIIYGRWMIFSWVSAQYDLHQKYACTCMHTGLDVRSRVYTQPLRAFTRTLATARVKRVDMLHLCTYTEGGHYFGWVLFYGILIRITRRICQTQANSSFFLWQSGVSVVTFTASSQYIMYMHSICMRLSLMT